MKRLTRLVIAGVLLAGAPVLAHHALHSQYDTAKRGKFRGELTKFSMINPHVRWFFDVTEGNGSTSKWEVTGAGPQALRANGLTRIFKISACDFCSSISEMAALTMAMSLEAFARVDSDAARSIPSS